MTGNAPDLLETIVAATRRSVEARQEREPMASVAGKAEARNRAAGRFRMALLADDRVSIFTHPDQADNDVTLLTTRMRRSLAPGSLLYLGEGRSSVDLDGAGDRLLVLGGEPFAEKIVMWWNFIGRSHDEVVEFLTPGREQMAYLFVFVFGKRRRKSPT